MSHSCGNLIEPDSDARWFGWTEADSDPGAGKLCRKLMWFSLLERTNEDESLGASHWLRGRDGHDCEFSICLGIVREADDGRDRLEIIRRAMGLHFIHRV